MNKHPSWTQVTQTEERPANDGIDFSLTPQEMDIAVMAKLDILAKFGRGTEGLSMVELQSSDLTDSERAAFGMGGV